MKELFKWYFPLSDDEIRKIWEEGILTVDTNVLLDLYRYHEDTREALLSAINSFDGRAWIPHQVAEEFFRNRNGVILSSNSAFNDAEKNIYEVQKSIEEPLKKIKSNRIIPDELEERLEQAIKSATELAIEEVQEIRGKYPDYRVDDPILDNICNLFDGKVGSSFSIDKLPEILKEAKRRKDSKIPPGYKDSSKDGVKPYGDYIIWRQVMDHIKEANKPLIFVTSEQKEDWWEKSSGKTIGPLYELLKEFFEETGQRFLLYRTDRFLEYSGETSGESANVEAVEEIREFVRQRSRKRPLVSQIDQDDEIKDTDMATGTLNVTLSEPAYKFTCSGRFEPEMSGVPILEARLVNSPSGTPNNFVRCGTGTKFDFNIHMKSTDYGERLPAGQYEFEYEAIVDESND